MMHGWRGLSPIRSSIMVVAATTVVAADVAARAAPPAAAVRRAATTPLPAARDVIRRHVDAVGGEGAIARISSRYVWAAYEVPSRHLRGSVEVFAARPNKRVIKVQYPDVGAEISGFDGVRGWTVSGTGTAKLVSSRQLIELRDQSVFDFDVHADSLFRSMETVEETDFEGHRCLKLRLTSVLQRTWYEFYDLKTGLFAGSIAPHETDLEPVTLKTVVEEYGIFSGVRVPTRITLRAAGIEEIIKVRDVKSNEVSGAKFELPPKLRPPGS